MTKPYDLDTVLTIFSRDSDGIVAKVTVREYFLEFFKELQVTDEDITHQVICTIMRDISRTGVFDPLKGLFISPYNITRISLTL